MVEREPGRIVGPLASLLGIVFNAIFDFCYMFAGEISLGVSIIIITLIMRTIILPFGMKSHKSMMKMQRVAPEMDAIKKKYEGKDDPELKRKMQIEIQQLYSKHNINPLMGCLPMLGTMPVFFGLNFIMRQMFLYVNRVNEIYTAISEYIIQITDNAAAITFFRDMIGYGRLQIVPNGMTLDFHIIEDTNRIINRFTDAHWAEMYEFFGGETAMHLQSLVESKTAIETFLGLNMVVNAGWGWPGIIIPIMSVITTALSSYLIQRANKSTDPQQKMQQRIMLIGMPVFIGYITTIMPIGVGIYWVTSNIYQVCQHYVMTRYYANKPL
jgi:YidC/Oxa1 family membrane protein insertase